jgi:hypothetical protein
VANDLIGAIRQQRTFVVGDLEKMPWLPKRATVDEFKEYGLVNLVHTQHSGAKPWIRHGFYRLIRHKRLYVVEIGPNTTRGQAQSAWLYEPVVRAPSRRITKTPCVRTLRATNPTEYLLAYNTDRPVHRSGATGRCQRDGIAADFICHPTA